MTLLEAIDDASLFAPWFERSPGSWKAWRVFIAALFGLSLRRRSERALFRECTGRTTPPDKPAREAWLLVGRRGGKSFVLALVAVFIATFRDYRPYLNRGERATVVIVAADRRQARTVFRYLRALLTEVPMLAQMIEAERAEAFDLRGQVTIEVHSASFKTVRGYTVCAAILDECAFWPTDESAAQPDSEIIAALRPAMSTIPNSLLLAASTPYARRGELFNAYRRHFGKDGNTLVWKAHTRLMNPSVPESVIKEAFERDPVSAASEFGDENVFDFRSDIAQFIDRAVVEACISEGIRERPPVSGVQYAAFVDPSGGLHDSMTLAIAHREGDAAVIDAVREQRPPFSPDACVKDFVRTLKSFRVNRVVGDAYAGEWARQPFERLGVSYVLSNKTRSNLYLDALPHLNSRNVQLLDDPRTVTQFCGLERRTSRTGKDIVDHGPHGHDDVVNSVCGAIDLVLTRRHQIEISGIVAPEFIQLRGGEGDRDYAVSFIA